MAEKYVNENGLIIMLEPMKEVASISAGLWINSGSRDEKASEYGYAHFVEHMLFKGTAAMSAKDIAREIDRVGGQHNAATNREYTCYYINVVSDYLELAIKILADMYANSVFDPEELGREKNVIIEEIRMYEDTPDEFIHDIFVESMLDGHPLSHSILGTIEGISGSTRESVVNFYNENYRENNSIFVIAGAFNLDDTRKLIDRYFNKKSDRGQKAGLHYPQPKRLYHNHIERDLEQIHFCLGTEGIKRNDDNRWALYCMSTILGGNMSSRLFQNIREKKGISYSIYSFHSSYSDNGIFGIYCATSPDKFEQAVELIMEECRTILKAGILTEELDDSKTYIKGNLALSYESTEVRMGQLAKNEMTYGKIISFDEIISELNSITLDDFYRITKNIFENKKFSLISVGKLNGYDYTKLNLEL